MLITHAVLDQEVNHLGLLVLDGVLNSRNCHLPYVEFSLEFSKCRMVQFVKNALLHVGAPAVSGNCTDASLKVSMVLTSEHVEHAVHDSGFLHFKLLFFVGECVKLPDREVVIRL